MSNRIWQTALVFAFVLALSQTAGRAATRECRDDLRESDNYVIRSITVEGRWVQPISLPIQAGDRFTNAGVQEAMRAVHKALSAQKTFEMQNLGSLGVLEVTRCLLVEGGQVDVIIQPRYVRVDLYRVGSNILPIPRSLLPSFYPAVPSALLALHPAIGIYQDDHYGFASTFSLSGNLLDWPALWQGEEPNARESRLQLIASGRKSLEHSFYNANANLSLSREKTGEFVQSLVLETSYAGKDEPQGGATFSRQALELGGSVQLKPTTGWRVSVGGKYRWSDNRFTENGARASTTESALEGRVIADGRIGGGFLRGAFWGDAGWPEAGGDYARIAGLLGFEREFALAPNQTVGVEAIIGGGQTWGAPNYARFYGGNSDRNFLYDNIDSPASAAFPTGPWIRSFGEGQALAARAQNAGATSYWNLNLNVALPIPGLSHPLIPDEEVADGVTLKQLLKNKAGDSVNFYAAQLAAEGLSREEALAKARAAYGEVQPAVGYIADRANVYSLKPLLMCDVAQFDAPGTSRATRVAAGGGLQLMIVTAKLEVGYLHTVAGQANDPSGNFFARLVFQNLF